MSWRTYFGSASIVDTQPNRTAFYEATNITEDSQQYQSTCVFGRLAIVKAAPELPIRAGLVL